MWNRVDTAISVADKADIKNFVEGIRAKLSFLVTQTPKERKRAGWTASPKALELSKIALKHGRISSNLLTSQIDLDALERDINLVMELKQIESMLQSLSSTIEDTRLWVQKEGTQQSMVIYKLLKIAHENGLGTTTAVEEMQPLMPATGRRKKK